MRQPQKVTCDKCNKEIDTEKPWTTFSVAVPQDIADDIKAEWAKQPRPPSIFGFDMPVPTPTHFHLDICRGCEDPDLRPLVAMKVIEILEKQRARAQEPNARPMLGGRERE